ncbi:MAG: helix-turn-helix domain-containing protein [Actinomycetota bacterium]|nr:helix-turn-helix domain-containing protein [Actinomycetota bacterium]
MDLRQKIVDAVLSGRPEAQLARSFGVGISTVERYVSKAQKGESLAPKRPPGKRRRLDEAARRLLEQDLQDRPAATLSQRREFLQRVAGVKVSDSTVSRMEGRTGWSRKKDRWERQNATSS